MAKFSEVFFCPAPWTEMYYHIKECSPCHLIKNNLNLTPLEYLESDWLKNLKSDFINGKVPSLCGAYCKSREDLGLKSTRGAVWNYDNIGESKELDISQYTLEKETIVERLEIRTSNLCNQKCRMCDERSSSEIAKEKQKFSIPLKYENEFSILKVDEYDLRDLKNIPLDNTKTVCFTGGEPLIIKEYVEYMDYLIERGLNKQIGIELFTNCSVYNPKFMEKLLQFDKVSFVMSIDGVGKTAEYQRKGTDWNTSKENILKFITLRRKIHFNTAITPYVLLDISSLSKFLMELYELNNNIATKCYSVINPQEILFENMNFDLRERSIKEIDDSLEILTVSNFDILKQELMNIKTVLKNTELRNPDEFVSFTKKLDEMRNERFEDVFGYKLY